MVRFGIFTFGIVMLEIITFWKSSWHLIQFTFDIICIQTIKLIIEKQKKKKNIKNPVKKKIVLLCTPMKNE